MNTTATHPKAATRSTLLQLASDASLYSALYVDEGTEAQIATENELFRFLREELGLDEDVIQEATHKATLNERIDWATRTGLDQIHAVEAMYNPS